MGCRIESRYENFATSVAEVSSSVSQLESVVKEAEALENAIHHHLRPGLQEANKEVNETVKQMRELSFSVQSANRIKTAYDDMEKINELVDKRRYIEASSLLKNLEISIGPGSCMPKCINEEDGDTKRALKAVRTELVSAAEKVHHYLGKDWDEHVQINTGDKDDRLVIMTVDLVNSGNGTRRATQIVQAMRDNDMLAYRLNKFGTKLMTLILKPIMCQSQAAVEIEKSGDPLNTLQIRFDTNTACLIKTEKSKATNSNEIIDSKAAMDKLEEIFFFLNETTGVDDNVFLSYLGKSFSKQFSELFIRKCLAPAVPDTRDGLIEYEQVIERAKTLRSTLTMYGFLESRDTAVLDYTANVETTFANKRCQNILAQARNIMKEDLHLVTQVEPPNPAGVEKSIDQTIKAEMGIDLDEVLAEVSKIDVDRDELSLPLPVGMSLPTSVGLFVLPKCQVSNSVFKLIALTKETLEEATRPGVDAFYAGRLLCTARNIFEMYQDVLPIAHRDTLANFPQSSAIAYNNCMYLAHQCLTIGQSVLCNGRKLPPPLNARAVTLADLVPRLRRCGVEIFLQQMRRQRDQLRTILRDSSAGLGQLSGDHLLPPASEKCIRQVLHQLNHLRKVWSCALPINIYKRAIGTILNSVVEELVERVLILEDIAADSAVQICSLFSVVRDKASEGTVQKLSLIYSKFKFGYYPANRRKCHLPLKRAL